MLACQRSLSIQDKYGGFAKSAGIMAKTDAIDARAICRFARAVNPKQRTIKDTDTSELTALVTRRRQIVKMLVAEQNQLKQAAKRNQKDIKDHIKWFKKPLDNIDNNIRRISKTVPYGVSKTICGKAARALAPSLQPNCSAASRNWVS
jgi:transposase